MQKEIELLLPSAAGQLFDPPVTGSRVRQLIDEGTIPAVRASSGYRLVAKSDVLDYLQRRRKRASEGAREVQA